MTGLRLRSWKNGAATASSYRLNGTHAATERDASRVDAPDEIPQGHPLPCEPIRETHSFIGIWPF